MSAFLTKIITNFGHIFKLSILTDNQNTMKTLKSLVIVALAAVMLFGCKSAPKEEKIPVGVQLYSVRDNMEQDFYGTLKAIKEMGYDGVEFAGLFGNTPEQVKAWCDELELNPISAHVPLADMMADIDGVIKTYKAIGCQYLAVPYLPEELRPGTDQFEPTVAAIAELAKKVKAAGMTLLYHNHDFEFKTLEDGTYGLDYIYSTVPADLLQTELDLCWVKYSGIDPAEYLRKYTDRSPVVHFKDYYFEGEKEGDPYALIGIEKEEEAPKTVFEFRPLGCGMQDLQSLIDAFKDAHSKWIIVEQDNPSMGMCPMASIKKGLCNLKHMLCPGECEQKECCDKQEGCCDKKDGCSEDDCAKCDKAEGCEKSCCEEKAE